MSELHGNVFAQAQEVLPRFLDFEVDPAAELRALRQQVDVDSRVVERRFRPTGRIACGIHGLERAVFEVQAHVPFDGCERIFVVVVMVMVMVMVMVSAVALATAGNPGDQGSSPNHDEHASANMRQDIDSCVHS